MHRSHPDRPWGNDVRVGHHLERGLPGQPGDGRGDQCGVLQPHHAHLCRQQQHGEGGERQAGRDQHGQLGAVRHHSH